MKTRYLILTAIIAIFTGSISLGQSQHKVVDIYYEDLHLTQRIASISPSDYIKFSKRPVRQTFIPDNLTDEEKREWIRDYSHLHVAISNKDTIELLRKYVSKLEPETTKKTFDTFIAIVDHENYDTICLNKGRRFNIYYNQTIMKPDTAFSQFVYDIIKYRDPDFVCAAF